MSSTSRPITIDSIRWKPTVSLRICRRTPTFEGKNIKTTRRHASTNGRIEICEAARDSGRAGTLVKGVRGIIIPATMVAQSASRGYTEASSTRVASHPTSTCGPLPALYGHPCGGRALCSYHEPQNFRWPHGVTVDLPFQPLLRRRLAHRTATSLTPGRL